MTSEEPKPFKWIPVDVCHDIYIPDKRLSNFRGHILVTSYKQMTGRYKVVQVFIEHGRITGNVGKIDKVIAWMPLPDPYKGVNKWATK